MLNRTVFKQQAIDFIFSSNSPIFHDKRCNYHSNGNEQSRHGNSYNNRKIGMICVTL